MFNTDSRLKKSPDCRRVSLVNMTHHVTAHTISQYNYYNSMHILTLVQHLVPNCVMGADTHGHRRRICCAPPLHMHSTAEHSTYCA